MSESAPNPDSLTAKLLQTLADKGYSNSEVARTLKLHQPRVSRWSRGEGCQSADDALRIAEFNSRVKPKPGSRRRQQLEEAAAKKP